MGVAAPEGRKLFGTDGVRGVAGEKVTAERERQLRRQELARDAADTVRAEQPPGHERRS